MSRCYIGIFQHISQVSPPTYVGVLSPRLLSEVAPPARRGGFYRIKIRHRTKFAASYSIGKLTCVVPNEKQFTGRNPSSCTRRRSIRLSPIVEYSRLQPPVGVWTVLSSIVGGHALTPPTRHRLGEPLPHQLADRTEAPPRVNCFFTQHFLCATKANF